MELKYIFAAGGIMQSVYILRDHRLELTDSLKLGELQMRRIGLNAVNEQLVTVKTEKFRCVFLKKVWEIMVSGG